jgi:acyl-coenzyme A thioesterase PaaI-like protein
MTRALLTNTFGFDTCCFVCDPDNPRGLRLQFYYDDESSRVVAEATPEAGHSGAPAYTHGGFSMAVLDDAMAWAIIAMAKKFGLSQHIAFEFKRPVKIHRTYAVEAWLEAAEEQEVIARAEVRDSKGRACITATSRYVVMSIEQATQAIGADATGAAPYTSSS